MCRETGISQKENRAIFLLFLSLDVFLSTSVYRLVNKGQTLVKSEVSGHRLEVAIENMRLNFGSEMGTECRFKSDSHGPIGIAELCKVESGGRREEGEEG